jgi:hypothetical protein
LKELEVDNQSACTIDIQKAAQTALQLSRRYSLEDLLKVFLCPFKHLHTAGNDANFTLKALLMIVGKYARSTDLQGSKLLSTFQGIAQSTRFQSTVWLDKHEEDWVAKQEAAIGGILEEQQEKNRQA